MSVDTGRERIDEGRQLRRVVERLAPTAGPGQVGELLAPSAPQESADRSKPTASDVSRGPEEQAKRALRGVPTRLARWRRLGDYGLALLLVATAALLRWAFWGVLSPTPFLVFYLAWVAAAAFGGLGPGLLAVLASWWCIDFLFDPTPSHIGFNDMASVARFLIFLSGGLMISVVGERMRRSRRRERRQTGELAAANAALRASEEKYRFLVENSKDVTWAMDLQGRWTFISSNVEKVAGYRADEIIGKTLWDFLAPECHDLVKEKLRRRLAGEDLPPYEVMMVGKDGRYMPFEVHATAVVDDRGNIVGVQGVSRDVTERKRAEAALRASEEKYRFLVENSKDITWMVDLQGTWTFISSNVEEVAGYRADEVVGRTIWDFLAPECHDLVKENLRRHVRGEDVPPYEVLVVGKDGRHTPFEAVTSSIVDEAGNVVGVQGVSRDVTERQRAEAALRASEEKYRLLVENSKDITWTVDLQGHWTFISSNLEKVTGHRADELIGQSLWDFLAPESRDLVKEKLRRRLRGEDLPPYEVMFVGKDGRHMPFEVLAASIVDEAGNVVGVQGVSRDITERKQAEQDLRESRNRYQALIETTADFIWEMDTSGKYTYCSPQMKSLWGYEPKDMIGKTPFDVMPPEDRTQAIEGFMALAKSPQPFTGLEASSYDRQGRLITVEVSGVPFFDADGRLLGYRGISRDVTERKRAQEALAESRKKYRGLVEKVNDWVWEIDANGVYTYSSPRALDLLGYAPEEIVGKTPFDFMPPAEAQRVWDAFQPIWLERKPLEQLENTLVRKDGRLVTVETSGMPVFAEDGAFRGYSGIDRDVTARKQAAEALRESEERFRKIFEEGPIGMVLTSRDFGFFRANPAFCRMLGYTSEEMNGLTFLDVTHPEHRAADRDNVERLWQGEIPIYRTEKRYIAKNGDIRWGNLSASLIQDRAGRPLYALAIVEDITERKWAEEQLRRSEQDLNRAQAVAQTGSWRLDVRRNELLWSNETYRMFGIPQGTPMTYETFLAAVDPADREYVDRQWTAALRGEPYDIEHRMLAEGQLKWVHEKAELEFDEAGTLLGGFGTVQDITERKRAEEALRAARSMLESVMDNVPQAIFWKDRHSTYLGCNHVFAKAAGLESAGDIVGKTDYDLPWSPEQTASFREYDRRIMENDAPEYHIIEQQREVSGKLAWVETNKVPLHDAQGQVIGILGTYEDITERKQAEEALRESEEKFRLLAETSPAAILIYQDGKYVYANPAAESITGYSCAELLPQAIEDIIHPDYRQQVKQMVSRRAQGEGPPMHYELKTLTKDGQERWMDSATTSIMHGNKPAGLVVAFDITERKRAEEALRQSEEKYKRLIETTDTGYVIIDAQGRVVDANQEYARLTGRARVEDVVGHSVLEWTSPGDVERNAAEVQECVERGFVRNLEVDYLTPTGQLIPVEINATVLRAGGSIQILTLTRDITERKRAEEALQASEEKYRRIVETATEAIVMVDAEARITFVNDRWSEIVGYSREESEQMTVFDLVFREDIAVMKKRWESCKQGRKERYEFRLRRKDGSAVWVLISMAPRFGPPGEFLGELIMAVDITRRKKAEESLRQEKTFTDKLFNAPRDTVFLFEPATGQPIRWNKRFAEVSGYDDKEIAGMRAPDDFYDENDLQKARESIAKIAAEGQGVVELSLITKRGAHIPFEYAATVVRTEEGKTLFLSLGRDITERKRAEEALRESEERFRIMADGSPNPIWVTDADGERIFANRQYLEYFGISEQEIEGGEWQPFLHPEDAPTYVNSFLSSLQEHRPFSAETRVRRADGQWRWIASHAQPRLSMEGEFLGFVGITQDITERRETEERLREWNATLESRVAQRTAQLQDRARQLQKLTLELTEAEERERQRLAEILHDDLQQVLAAAKFQVGLLDDRVRNDVESQEIVGQTKDLLVDAIAKSRSLSHELRTPALSQGDLREAFEWLAEQMRKKHRLTIHLEMGEQIEVTSEPLRVLLYKAAQELLFNVTKHAGVSEAKLRLRRQRGRLRLSVSDKGRGFESGLSGPALGFGLLSIRERVEYLGGRMKIHSAPGKGSIFAIAVPDTEVQAGK